MSDKNYLEEFEISDNNSVVVDGMKAYLKSISNHPRLTPEEEKNLSWRAQNGDQAAINKLVESNLLLVVSIAKKYYGCGLPLMDLIQEGNLGLMKAAERYDGEKGFRFSTYATYWIKQAISRALGDKGRTIRIPANVLENLAKVKKAYAEFIQEGIQSPDAEQLAARTGIELSKVKDVLDLAQVNASLDTPVDDDGETSMGDLIADSQAEDGFAKLVLEANREIIDRVFATLNEREAEILRMRFGFDRNKPMTLVEIGDHYGLSKERIRQLEGKAIRKLRNPLRLKMLQEAFA